MKKKSIRIAAIVLAGILVVTSTIFTVKLFNEQIGNGQQTETSVSKSVSVTGEKKESRNSDPAGGKQTAEDTAAETAEDPEFGPYPAEDESGVYERLDRIIKEQAEDAEYEGYIFSLKDPEDIETIDSIEKSIQNGAKISKIDHAPGTYTAENPEEIKKTVDESKLKYVEPDYKVYMLENDAVADVDPDIFQEHNDASSSVLLNENYSGFGPLKAGSASAAAPNDKYYETNQYNIKDLNVPAVWEYGIEGQDFDESVDVDGNGSYDDDEIVVAVIDSGLKEGHEDIDWDRVIAGRSFADGTQENETNDTDGHGTFVSGLIAAIKDNEVGTAGILQCVKIMPVRVFNGESASDSVIVNGINYAAEQKEEYMSTGGKSGANIEVINMSLGSSGTSSSMDEACQRAIADGIIVVCAAGNDGNGTASYPAQYSMGVGSTNSSKTVSSYSQRLSKYNGTDYANKVWVAAPGEAVTSLYCENTRSYAQMSGTSFSSPEVAALAAVCKSLKNDITQAEFMQLLKDTSDYKVGASGDIEGQDIEYGWGLVNFKNTVDQLITEQFGEQTGDSVLSVRVQNEAGSVIEDPFVSIYEIKYEDGKEQRGDEIPANEDGTWTLNKGGRYYYAAHAEKYDYKEETFATLTDERTLTITLQGKAYPVTFDIINTAGEKIDVSLLEIASLSGTEFEPDEKGIYMLRNGTYTYYIEADSYFDTKGSFVIDDIAEDMENGKTVQVVLRGNRDVCSLHLRVMGDSEDGDITGKCRIVLTDEEDTEISVYKDGDYKLEPGTYSYTIYHDEYKTVQGTITIDASDIGQNNVININMNGKLYTVIFHIFPLSSDPEVLIYDGNAEVYERQPGVRNADYRSYRLTEGTYYYSIKDETKGTYQGSFTLNDGTVSMRGLKIADMVIMERSGKREITINMQSNSPDAIFTDNTDIPLLEDIVPVEPEIPEHVHKYISTVTKEATCTEPGELTWVCEAGDDQYTEEIPMIPHQFDEDGICVMCGIHDYETIEDEDWLTLVLDAGEDNESTRKVSLTQLAEYQSVKTYTMIYSYYGTSISYTVYGITFRDLIEHFVGHDRCVSAMHITAMDIAENRDSNGELYYVDLDREQLDNAMIAWYTINNSSGEERTGSNENNMRVVINNGYSNDWMYGPDVLEITYGEHEYEKTETVPPTCTEDGYTVYSCSICGNSYRDDIVPASGHVFDPDKDIVTQPTCTSRGYTMHVCDVCGEKVIDSYIQPFHRLTETAAVEATCTEDGNTKYYTCDICGKYFTDEDGLTEIEADSWIIPATGHDWAADEWIWSEDLSAAEIKLVCLNDPEHKKTAEAKIDKNITEPEKGKDGLAVYTAEAVYEGKTFTDVKEVVLPYTDEGYEVSEWQWSTDDEGTVYALLVLEDSNGNKVQLPADQITGEIAEDASCDSTGVYTYTATLAFSGNEYTDSHNEQIPATGHDWDDGEITVQPGCSQTGMIVYTCKNDSSHTMEEILPATGHDYALSEWKWSGDMTSAEAVFVCRNDDSHTEAVQASVEKKLEKEATEEEKGEYLYTAKAEFGSKTYTDTRSEEIPAKGKKDIKPERILLNEVNITMPTSSEEKASVVSLKASVLPENASNKDVKWISSDETVAKVDKNGNVTALKYGAAVITAISAEDESIKAECIVNTRYYDVNGTNVKNTAGYQYYYDAVYWAADNNITKGYGVTLGDGTKVPDSAYFGPERNCQRREMLIFLWRLAGSPVKDGKGKAYGDARKMFKDMNSYGPDTATNKAVAWGYKEGIVKGYSDGGFHPAANIIRKDTMIMLYRLAGRPAVSGTVKFTDVKEKFKTSTDTYKAILWGSKNGITNGYSDGAYAGQFGCSLNCLREHIVTFIYRFKH